MSCGAVRSGTGLCGTHGQSHGPSGRRSPTAAAAAGPCELQRPFNGRFGVARAEVEPVLPRARPLVPAATGQGAHRSSEYSSTRLRVSFVGRPQCHAAVRALRFHGPCAFGIGVMAPAASYASGRPHRRHRSTSEVPSSVHSAPCAAAAPRAEAPEVSASVQTMLSPFHLGRSHLRHST